MEKIEKDKYYTPQHIVDLVIQRTKEVIGLDNISEFIEPSAGNVAFLDKLYELGKPVYAYDLYPERDDIKEQDFLKLDKEYVRGTCIIGNPPFGIKNTLSVKFYKKSISLCDYIVFILPISQLNNNQQMYEFDLIHSEDLKIQNYTNKNVHCCLNIYKKPVNLLNDKPKFHLKDVKIIESRFSNKIPKEYDVKLLAWGTGLNNLKLGGFLESDSKEYSKVFYIKINKQEYKYDIINILKNVKWEEIYPMTATPNLLQWQVYKYLKEQIPELE